MHNAFLLLLLFVLSTGCTDNAQPHEHPVPDNNDNDWTSQALQNGDLAAIEKKVLAEPGYLDERDYIGNTPLLNAIDFGNLQLVRFLLQHGADPNVSVDDGYTCLLSAIESDAEESTPIVEALLQAGADIHHPGTNGWTPLHMAAYRGQLEKARLLIKAGADVNRRKEIDASETPLMEAAYAGQPAMVRLLLEHGADPTLRDTMDNHTSLEMAKKIAKGPDPDVIDLLRKESTDLGIDLAQSYIDSVNELKKTGNHAEVIRILTEYR